MPVHARRLIRKMRGGAQAHLIEADDGHFYVVKFRNNPQHRRVLVNEWMGGTFLRYLGITVPDMAIVDIGQTFLSEFPETAIVLGARHSAPTPGWHFGSRFPGHPDRVAVYDFVPDTLLDRVENIRDFVAALVFDKWTANADARQSVFLRARLNEYVPGAKLQPSRMGFIALMVDHGYLFNGPHWEYIDAPMTGLYFRTSVYREVRSLEDFQPWLDRIVNFPEEIVDDALRSLPPDWLNGDADSLYALLERLMERRRRVPELLTDCCRNRATVFPAWNPPA
ncbi:MAG: hypothetical protein H7Y20_05240 [Bryobacteraceae bacterium]|nr:hypothetical protein [Bryobacteraceae bacterium]